MFKKEVSNEEIRDLLVQLMVRLDSLEEEVKKVSKHVPFVDHLANSGAVRAVTGLNRIMAGLNPTNFLPALPTFPVFLIRDESTDDESAADESAEDTKSAFEIAGTTENGAEKGAVFGKTTFHESSQTTVRYDDAGPVFF